MADSWRLTLPCTRAEAEALPDEMESDVVLVASEPDPARSDCWRIDAYFEGEPSPDLQRRIAALAPSAKGPPRAEPIPAQDWVSLSQAGFEPLMAGRFRVRTPDHPPLPGTVDFVIPAGLAFGTGQHATTAGCLEALDALEREGARFANILDLGTGTGLLAFSAAHLWPSARVAASDIDPVSIAVVRDNAVRNGVRGLLLVVADGLDEPRLAARAPYDLIIANVLAGPLIDMAASIAAHLAADGTLILAGLLDAQAESVIAAYRAEAVALRSQGDGEWPVLVMRQRAR